MVETLCCERRREFLLRYTMMQLMKTSVISCTTLLLRDEPSFFLPLELPLWLSRLIIQSSELISQLRRHVRLASLYAIFVRFMQDLSH
jgi:hypothetical protein